MPHTLTIEYGDDLLLSLGMSADDDEQYSAPDFSQTCPCQGTNLVLESRPVDRLNLRDVDDTGFAEIGFALTQANVTSESGEFEVARDGEDDRRAAPPRLGTGLPPRRTRKHRLAGLPLLSLPWADAEERLGGVLLLGTHPGVGEQRVDLGTDLAVTLG